VVSVKADKIHVRGCIELSSPSIIINLSTATAVPIFTG
jgi:hypothetical protein